jgi:hypothetical protein
VYDDRWVARKVAASYGLPGVPVSMRTVSDLPQPGVGTGHWARRVRSLAQAVGRARAAVEAAPPGAFRDELIRVHGLLDRRLTRYTRIAEIGQALQPDDDTTLADDTRPGRMPTLRGAAVEIDARLVEATGKLSSLATAVERLAAGLDDETVLRAEIAALEVGEG